MTTYPTTQMKKLPFADDRDVWERQPKETRARYYMFSIYRDLPPHNRSIKKTAEIVERAANTLATISVACRWVERSDAFDAFNEQQRMLEYRETLRELDGRDLRILAHTTKAIEQRLNGDPDAGIDAIDINRMSMTDIARLHEITSKMVRLRQLDDKGLQDLEGIKIEVSFPFNPQYSDDPQGEEIELPPANFRELEEGELDSDPPVV